jgi:RNA polymerase sigma-70 factor (ECF subfamily)
MNDKHEAEDLVQEALQSAWNSRHLFNPENGSERAWLHTILKRRMVDKWRRPAPPTPSCELEVMCFDTDPSAYEFTDEVKRALDRLSPELCETMMLVAVHDLTHQEAADKLGVPLGTVLSRVHRTKGHLRNFLSDFTP